MRMGVAGAFAVVVGAAFVLAGCGDSVPDRAEYELLFEDGFNGTALDGAKWTVVAPADAGADHVAVQGGSLRIQVPANGAATSALVHSAGKFSFRYGRVEVGARLPVGAGVAATLRLLPERETYGPWPLSGAIGLAEGRVDASGGAGVRGVTRYGLSAPPHHGAAAGYDVLTPNTTLVEYALEWMPGELRFFADGDHVQTQTASEWFTYYPANAEGGYDPLGVYRVAPFGAPFDRAFHLAIGLEVASSVAAPVDLAVDFVRVYGCAGTISRCGSRDPTVAPLRDGAGGPLANANTGKPFREQLDLYADGPGTVAAPEDGATGRRALVTGYQSDGAAIVVSEPNARDPDDAANTAWRVTVDGGAAAVHLAAEATTTAEGLATGFDLSGSRLPGPGGEPLGEIAFNMRVAHLDPDATLSVGLSSGYPGEPRFALPRSSLSVGAWKAYSAKFRDLIEPSADGCCGLALANVTKPFELRASGGADVLLDNIRVTNACKVVGACGANTAHVADPRRACAAPGATLRYGFYAYFAPVSHSAVEDPASPGFNTHSGYEADLISALEAMQGAELAFARRPIDFWTGIWLQSATPAFDVVGGGITILDSRTRDAAGETVVRFTEGHIAFRQSLLVRAADAERLATHAMLTSTVRVGALADTTGEARLLQLTGLADERGVLVAGARVETPGGAVTADGTDAYRITSAGTTANMAGRTRLVPPGDAGPQVVYLGYERGEVELLAALGAGAINAVARGEIGNSDAAAASGGRFVVTALDPQSEFGGFTVAADNPALRHCLNDKIRWLTDGGRIGYGQWRRDETVFAQRAALWNRF